MTLLPFLLVLPSSARGQSGAKKGSATRSSAQQYETRTIEGWTVLVSTDLLKKKPELADRTLELLRKQLEQAVRVVPPAAIAKLRSIRIWVEENEPHHPCMAYHPSAAWLREHGMSPEKARCVEVANVRNFLDWTRVQKWMVFHELAHAYHDRFVDGGFGNRAIRRAYDQAMKRRLYEDVTRAEAKPQKAYATTNEKEYFAELSEAYFGINDFFPFDRAELRRHDPAGYAMIEAVWGVQGRTAPEAAIPGTKP